MSTVTDLEHEGIAKLDGQLQLLDEIWVIEGGNAEVVPLFLLAYPVEGLLLRVNAEGVPGSLERRKGREGEGENMYVSIYIH